MLRVMGYALTKSHRLVPQVNRPPRLQGFVVRELAGALNLKPFQVIGDLMQLNIFAGLSQRLDVEIAAKVCHMHGWTTHVDPDDSLRVKKVEEGRDIIVTIAPSDIAELPDETAVPATAKSGAMPFYGAEMHAAQGRSLFAASEKFEKYRREHSPSIEDIIFTSRSFQHLLHLANCVHEARATACSKLKAHSLRVGKKGTRRSSSSGLFGIMSWISSVFETDYFSSVLKDLSIVCKPRVLVATAGANSRSL